MNQASVKRHLPRLIEHIRAGRVQPSDIITHRVPLEEVADAYHMFSQQARRLHQDRARAAARGCSDPRRSRHGHEG